MKSSLTAAILLVGVFSSTIPSAALTQSVSIAQARNARKAKARPTCADLPTGEWTGTGTYVLSATPASENENKKRIMPQRQRTYATELIIENMEQHGKRSTRLKVVSDSQLNDDGSKTRFSAELTPKEQLSETTVIYEFDSMGLGDKDVLVDASCMSADGIIVLQLQYSKEFWETYRFKGRQVEKR